MEEKCSLSEGEALEPALHPEYRGCSWDKLSAETRALIHWSRDALHGFPCHVRVPFAFTFQNLCIHGKKKCGLEYSNEYESHEEAERNFGQGNWLRTFK